MGEMPKVGQVWTGEDDAGRPWRAEITFVSTKRNIVTFLDAGRSLMTRTLDEWHRWSRKATLVKEGTHEE